MAQVKVEEGFFERREDVGKSVDVPFFVFDATDEAAVKAACDAAADAGGLPKAIGSCWLDGYSIEERINATTWKVIARYKRPEWNWVESPDGRFSFDTGGGTQHVTQSIQTVSRYGPKASVLLGGAIGYDGKSVQGVDITVPVYNWGETHYFRDDQVTRAYKMKLFNLTGHYNDGGFRGFAQGEVLFLGAAGDRQGDDPDDQWDLSFRFAASPNRTDIMVGDIGPIAKWGWEYLWVQYADDADDEKKQIIKKPVAVYIEKVYHGANFAELGIGTD